MKYHLYQDSLWKVVETAKMSDSKAKKVQKGQKSPRPKERNEKLEMERGRNRCEDAKMIMIE